MKSYRPALSMRQKLKHRMAKEELIRRLERDRTNNKALSERYVDGQIKMSIQPGVYERTFSPSININDTQVHKLDINSCYDLLKIPRRPISEPISECWKEWPLQKTVSSYDTTIPLFFVEILNDVFSESPPFSMENINPRVYVWVEHEAKYKFDHVRFKVFFEKLPIQVQTKDGIQQGEIPGPIELNFSVFVRVGYNLQLESIDTNNPDILHILKGNKLSEKDLLKYCVKHPVQSKVMNQELESSMQELSEALDVIGCHHPLAEQARDILVHVEQLSEKSHHQTFIDMARATTALIKEDKDLSMRVQAYESALNEMKWTANINILRGLGYSLLTLAMCLLVVTIPFLFMPLNLSAEFTSKITATPESPKHGFAALSFSIFGGAMQLKSLNAEASELLKMADKKHHS